ncbi:hypothetical protein [Chelativorans sp. J32]|uniref:hypothetical protein n=1 Tax=Chelativorans sp. J32 TaxID=935840 RepID=UPI00048769AB|nr:hypothetical protein [Chelativorans sp. J32]
MSSKMPPVPPANRSNKGTGDAKKAQPDDSKHGTHGAPDPDRQAQQGNSKVNTTHQGYQQDR